MERPIITLAPGLLRQTRVNWDIDWREQSTGPGTGGRRQILLGALPRWIGDLPVQLRWQDLGVWRAARLAGRGMTAIYRVRMIDPAVWRGGAGTPLEFDDGTLFSDEAGWGDWPIAPCPDGAAAGAEQIDLDVSGVTVPLAVGQILSHDDWPFAVTEIEDLGDDIARISIQPPLRAAIPADDPVELIGVGLFELTERGEAPAYGRVRSVPAALRLQEWLR